MYKLNKLSIFQDTSIILIDFDDISHLSAESNYTKVHTDDGPKMISKTLGDIQDKLPDNFMRVHKSWIINLNKLSRLDKTTKHAIVYGYSIPISRQRWKDVLNLLS